MLTIPLRILLVEDNSDIAANICESFENAGHVINYAHSAEMALSLIAESQNDLFIVDIMLPGMSGIELCRQIRENHLGTAPILVLTARTVIEDKLDAFSAGADDYLTKPFSTRELLARASVLCRRNQLFQSDKLKVGELELNVKSQTVQRAGTDISVGRIGFRIIHELLKAAPGVVLRDDMEHALWGEDRPDSDALRTHMSVLRKAIDKPFNFQMIQTVHGAGWKLITPNEE